MKCLKCGMEIADNSKFCGYCGNPVEASQSNIASVQPAEPVVPVQPVQQVQAVQQVQPVQQAQPDNGEQTVQSRMVNPNEQSNLNVDTLNANQNVSSLNVGEPINMPTMQPINMPTMQPTMQQIETPVESNGPKKKSSKTLLFVLLGVVGVAVITLLVLFLLNFNKTTKSSISVLEKALGNASERVQTSGTVVANVLVEDNNSTSINLSAAIKYQKANDKFNLQFSLDKSPFFDEMNLYAIFDKEALSLYTKSSVVDMLLGTMSDTDSWLYYTLPLTDIPFDIEFTNTEIDLSALEDNFKYVGKSGSSNHYTLTIDKSLLTKLESELPLEEYEEELDKLDYFDGTLVIDLYINNSNEIEKISMDLSKYLNNSEINKAIVSIEFKDYNNTSVVVPNEALTSEIDLETYLQSSMDTSEFEMDYDIDDYDFENNSLEDYDFGDFDFNDSIEFNF